MKAATQNITPTETPIAIATEFPCTPARLVTVDMALPIINLGFPVSLSRTTNSLSINFNQVHKTMYFSLFHDANSSLVSQSFSKVLCQGACEKQKLKVKSHLLSSLFENF